MAKEIKKTAVKAEPAILSAAVANVQTSLRNAVLAFAAATDAAKAIPNCPKDIVSKLGNLTINLGKTELRITKRLSSADATADRKANYLKKLQDRATKLAEQIKKASAK
jgi:hypothetical protein